MSRIKEAGLVLKDAAIKWSEDNASQHGAALSYYTAFSLAPLLLIVVMVAGMVWGGQPSEMQAHVLNEVQETAGSDAAGMLQTMLDNFAERGAGSGITAVLGIAGLLLGATGVFAQLQSSLNQIWKVKPDPERGLMNMVMTRVLSFGMILAIGFILLVSLVLSAAISALEDAILEYLPFTATMVGAIDLVLSLLIITLLFATIFYYLPDVEIAWKDVWIGAIITALLFVVGRFALSTYIAHSDMTTAFGAAGSLVVLLLWVYYSALIFFFGAEVTQIYAERYGGNIEPSSTAVKIDQEADRADPGGTGETHPVSQAASRASPAPAWGSYVAVLGAFVVGRWWGRR